MNCRRLESLAADFAAGRLSADLSSQMERHCETCASCARLMRSETQMRQAWSVRAGAEAHHSDLWPRIAQRLEPRSRRVSPAPRLVWSGAAALAVIAMVSLRPPTPPTSHPVPVTINTAVAQPAATESHVASTEAAPSWPAIEDVSASNAVVDDPAGRSMEEIWTHINSENN